MSVLPRPLARAGHRRRLPAPLAALLVVVALYGTAWALLTPPWQSPDENGHFAYVQSLAERGALAGEPGRPYASDEQAAAALVANSDQTAGNVFVRPEWSAAAYARWEREAERFGDGERHDGGGPNPASANPPLSYLFEVVPYALTREADVFTRLTAMRIASVGWLLVVCVAAWLLAGEVFGPRRLLQLVTAAVCGLLPMSTFIAATVSPEAMLYAAWALALWLGVRILKRGLTAGRAAAFAGVVAAAVLVKAASYALVPAAVLVLAVAAVRARRGGLDGRSLARRLAPAAAALVLPVLVWTLAARAADREAAAQFAGATAAGEGSVGGLLSYLWQYYLPRLPFLTDQRALNPLAPGFGLTDVWLDQTLGAFGWLEVRWPRWVYVTWHWIVAAGALALAAVLVRRRRRLDLVVVAFFAVVAVTLLAGLHWTDYRFTVDGGATFNQARYLFPLLPVAGLAVAQCVAALPSVRGRLAASTGLLAVLLAGQLLALGLVATRFYLGV